MSLASFLPFPPGQTQVIEGRLDKGDNTLKGGEYVDVHKVEVTESGEFTVRLNGDFDGYLIVQPPDYATTKEGQLENDDWEGDLTESRIVVENAQVGTWTVAVTTASKGVGGSYRLSLDLPGAGGDDASPRSKRTERGELSADDPTLGGGEHFDRFEIELGAGDVLTARLESSDFDTYLALADADANSLVQNDDFEGSQSVSQIEYTAETAQQVILIATSAKKGETGSYVLTLLQAGEHGDGRHYSGELSEGDEALETGSFVDLESLRGTPGARLRVDVTSPEFDTLLFVMDGEGEIIDRNDDFEGDAKHSRVEFTVPAGGSYIVAVTSYAKAEGTYEVRITPLDGAPSGEAGESGPVVRTENGRLEKGDATLETGEFLDVYPLEVTEGEELHIELDSADFDAYLILVQLEGDPIQQDDFDGSTNPRLDYIATGTGTVNVVVTSAKPGETGDYALTIQRGSGTEEESALDTLTGELANGDSTLDTGEFYDSFEYEMVEGRTYLIAMSSADFNAYVG
ncbi:MAG TPA: hypothetical protein ENJ09_14640, partial [Planctomycetes bacterium]|nr:hypothetical protein [Planctomycetota bacterium]